MGEFGRTDLSMDLNLNLRPPSPPPHLGLGLALASAPFADNDFISRPPDLISPRFEPRTSQSGFGDHEPAFVASAGAAPGREGSGPEESHLASGRNSRYRWRRLRPTPVADCSPVAFAHVTAACSEVPAEEQRPKNEVISKAEEANQCANFDCNICLAMASEPVVTPCGHLFCWPCLYQWLHVHSTSNECPVCKGEVTDVNITPIYGRGVKPAAREDDGSRMAVPPRPHGHRVESSRHRRRMSRPFSRRVEEIIRLRNGHGRAEGFDGTEAREGERIDDLIGAVSDHIMHRVRFARRLQGEEPEEGWHLRERIIGRRSRVRSATAAGAHVIINEVEGRMPVGLEGGEVFRDLHFSRRIRADRLVTIRTRLESMEGMLQTLTNANPHPTASAPLHLPAAAGGVFAIPEYRSDQGAVGQPAFEDNVPAPGIVQREIRGGEAVLEQGSVRSIHPHRRMDVQSSGAASGSSLDVDGELLHARKIRRLN